MASSNRAERIELLYKALKKHYKPVPEVTDRKVLDHLLYACCLEDASYEAADEAFAKLQQTYFDANEIRVTTIAELSESLTSLPKATAAANRIKKSLQALFEVRFSFDIEDLKKANLGKAVEEIGGWQGITKFVLAYVTQHAFGGHAIPVDTITLSVCSSLDLINVSEWGKGSLPGAERAIPKQKGIEFSALLHQFAVEYDVDFKHPIVAAVFKEMGVPVKAKSTAPTIETASAPPPAPLPEIKGAAPKESAASTAAKAKATEAAAASKAAKASPADKAEPSKDSVSSASKKQSTKEPAIDKAAMDKQSTAPKLATKPVSPAPLTVPTKSTTKSSSKDKPEAAPANTKGGAVKQVAAKSTPVKSAPAKAAPPKTAAVDKAEKPADKDKDSKSTAKAAPAKKAETPKAEAAKAAPKKATPAKPSSSKSAPEKESKSTKNVASKTPAAKPPAKKPATTPKPAAKKLPVRPATTKKTKPR